MHWSCQIVQLTLSVLSYCSMDKIKCSIWVSSGNVPVDVVVMKQLNQHSPSSVKPSKKHSIHPHFILFHETWPSKKKPVSWNFPEPKTCEYEIFRFMKQKNVPKKVTISVEKMGFLTFFQFREIANFIVLHDHAWPGRESYPSQPKHFLALMAAAPAPPALNLAARREEIQDSMLFSCYIVGFCKKFISRRLFLQQPESGLLLVNQKELHPNAEQIGDLAFCKSPWRSFWWWLWNQNAVLDYLTLRTYKRGNPNLGQNSHGTLQSEISAIKELCRVVMNFQSMLFWRLIWNNLLALINVVSFHFC